MVDSVGSNPARCTKPAVKDLRCPSEGRMLGSTPSVGAMPLAMDRRLAF